MNFDPQKLFIGLMDFFSILLPGAVLTWLMQGELGSLDLGFRLPGLDSTEGLAAFLLASYLLGHLIFLLGSWLDDLLYDAVRRRTLNAQIARLGRHGPLSWAITRMLVWLVFKDERDAAVGRARAIKEAVLSPLGAQDAINAFQWCKALLTIESPASFSEVERLEASSKFFRSLVVVLTLVLAWAVAASCGLGPRTNPLVQHAGHAALLLGVLGLLILLSLWRYLDQRYKATNQAYGAVITLTAQAGTLCLLEKPGKPDEPTVAGGVVFRAIGGAEVEYLVVEDTGRSDTLHWILPHGRADALDDGFLNLTAIRTVRDQAGVWARVVKDAGHLEDVALHKLGAAGDAIERVRFFAMEAMAGAWRRDRERRYQWLPLEAAQRTLSLPGERELLGRAQAVCTPSLRPLWRVVLWHRVKRLAAWLRPKDPPPS